MPIETAADHSGGQLLYEVIRSAVGKLTAGDQMSLGLAIQRDRPWASLSADQRRAFIQAANDLQL